MKYRNRKDGSLTTKSQLIAANPNASLPKTWTPATTDYLGVDPVMASPKPVVGEFEIAVANGAEYIEDHWVEAWTVQPMFVEYTDDDDVVVTAVEQQEAYTASKLTKKRASMEITMRQCRLALLADGTLANVDVAIDSLPEPDRSAAQVEWEYAAVVYRTSAFVGSLGVAIGYDDAAMDTMFEEAKEL